ncbi:Uncharacterized protein TCM_015043 [Theobroma cacao]|uniref:Uncharacterized protein n=1 Tax=Theobroma cacao TaxID=3641 RepID=A0A061G0E0_THECC|nr:Uncharacterized protein TCM_015043 [Theobroma cacao]
MTIELTLRNPEDFSGDGKLENWVADWPCPNARLYYCGCLCRLGPLLSPSLRDSTCYVSNDVCKIHD